MSQVTKCDRCGKLSGKMADEIGEVWPVSAPSPYELCKRVKRGRKTMRTTREVELCEACQNGLEGWMDARKK